MRVAADTLAAGIMPAAWIAHRQGYGTSDPVKSWHELADMLVRWGWATRSPRLTPADDVAILPVTAAGDWGEPVLAGAGYQA